MTTATDTRPLVTDDEVVELKLPRLTVRTRCDHTEPVKVEVGSRFHPKGWTGERQCKNRATQLFQAFNRHEIGGYEWPADSLDRNGNPIAQCETRCATCPPPYSRSSYKVWREVA